MNRQGSRKLAKVNRAIEEARGLAPIMIGPSAVLVDRLGDGTPGAFSCPKCGWDWHLIFSVRNPRSRYVAAYQCEDCGTWLTIPRETWTRMPDYLEDAGYFEHKGLPYWRLETRFIGGLAICHYNTECEGVENGALPHGETFHAHYIDG